MGIKRRLRIYEGLTILAPGVYGLIDSLSQGNGYIQSGFVGLLGLCAGGIVANLIEEGDRYLSDKRKDQEFKREMSMHIRDIEKSFDDELESNPQLRDDSQYLQIRNDALGLVQRIEEFS